MFKGKMIGNLRGASPLPAELENTLNYLCKLGAYEWSEVSAEGAILDSLYTEQDGIAYMLGSYRTQDSGDHMLMIKEPGKNEFYLKGHPRVSELYSQIKADREGVSNIFP